MKTTTALQKNDIFDKPRYNNESGPVKTTFYKWQKLSVTSEENLAMKQKINFLIQTQINVNFPISFVNQLKLLKPPINQMVMPTLEYILVEIQSPLNQ